jgi:hypothetical protein
MSNLNAIAEEFGELHAVTLSATEPGWNDEIRFFFRRGSLTVRADGTNDTIDLQLDPGATLPGAFPKAWQRFASLQVRWAWTLENHRGYADGLQLEFAQGETTLGVQIMVEASRLWFYHLEPFQDGRA